MNKDKLVGIISSFYPEDKLPAIEEKMKVTVKQITDIKLASQLTRETEENLKKRFDNRNLLFGVELEAKYVAFGWVAQYKAFFGKPEREITIPSENYYLWDFVTYPEFRGNNIYPNLLQTIIKQLNDSKHRFWILCHSENLASLKGIEKSGFIRSGEVYLDENLDLYLKPLINAERGQSAAQILNIKYKD